MSIPERQQKTDKPIYVIDANPDPGHATGGVLALWAYRRLLWDFVKRDLSYRYTGSAVGILWTVITPLMELITYTFVFHGLIGVSFQPQGGWTHYALFLFCGMVTWMAVSDGISHATGSVASHGQLITSRERRPPSSPPPRGTARRCAMSPTTPTLSRR